MQTDQLSLLGELEFVGVVDLSMLANGEEVALVSENRNSSYSVLDIPLGVEVSNELSWLQFEGTAPTP